MTPIRQQLLQALAEMWELYPEWRLGQLVQNVASWARQPTEPIDPTWDVEDEEFLNTIREHVAKRTAQLRADGPGVAASLKRT
jgi:hypothetical protein